MDVRIENALYVLIVTIIVQIFVMVFGVLMKKAMSPMPMIEIILRPFVINIVDKLNRSGRSDFALIIRGAITFFTIFAILCGVSYGVNIAMPLAGYPQWTHVVLLVLILSPLKVLKTAYDVSVEKPMKGSYLRLSQSLNQDLIPADKHGLRRAGVKAMALSLVEWMLAPILFYILGGVIGAYFYVSLSLFIRVSGQNSSAFTSVFRYIYKIMTMITAVIGTGVIFLSSLFSAGGKPLRVFRGFYNVEAAMAYAQNITVGGSFQNRLGETVKADWVGADGATAKLEHKDILRVMIQYGVTVFLLVVILFAIKIYT